VEQAHTGNQNAGTIANGRQASLRNAGMVAAPELRNPSTFA
jgi:hypothetical protein